MNPSIRLDPQWQTLPQEILPFSSFCDLPFVVFSPHFPLSYLLPSPAFSFSSCSHPFSAGMPQGSAVTLLVTFYSPGIILPDWFHFLLRWSFLGWYFLETTKHCYCHCSINHCRERIARSTHPTSRITDTQAVHTSSIMPLFSFSIIIFKQL